MTETNAIAIIPRAPGLPNLRLLRHLIRLNEEGNPIWTATQRPTTVPHNMIRQPLVVLGFYVHDAVDVREALTFGAAAARGLNTRHVSPRDWRRVNTLMEANSLELERAAVEEVA
ncbi:hypothetical protein [Maritimibacter fusiformis]|uniref:Uncharacterized protein n=1 Tax=Maritimibacter fusiformis TaxID=2603819 RepID=A0A5D0RNJ3_9RHOB|nr:hypothetical protein [Maritimibacter fusiformis]TYB83122.1 hypothetical protein FVF75_02770 [Maritimibacter fusiformis]